MGTLLLFQVGLDLALIAVITVLLIDRSKKRNLEDPRLSRGLQLLSNKIAVLQDLMDRSENTGKQLTQLLEVKQQDVQECLEEVERHLHRVNESIEKSKGVARLFQERIPHEEVIERQSAAKYIKAAKLANQGLSVDEIASQVDIPRGELELIAKINKQNLVSGASNPWVENLDEDAQMQAPGTPIPHYEDIPQEIVEEKSEEPVATLAEETAPVSTVSESVPIEQPVVNLSSAKTLVYTSHRRGGVELESPQIRPVIFKKIQGETRFP